MENKKKKKSKAPIIIKIIILLAAAGFCYYKFVWQPNDLEQYEIAEAPVETKRISDYNSWGAENELEELTEIMQTSDANLFCTYVNQEDCYVEQMTEEDFENVHATGANYREVSKKAVAAMDNFFNLSYNGMPNDPLGFTNGMNMFGTHKAYLSEENVINDRYNGDFLGYFNSHELKLSCSKTEVCKISYIYNAKADDSYRTKLDDYVLLLKSTVKTESAVGDLSDLDIYAPNGEEREIYVAMFICKDTQSKAFEIMNITFYDYQ